MHPDNKGQSFRNPYPVVLFVSTYFQFNLLDTCCTRYAINCGVCLSLFVCLLEYISIVWMSNSALHWDILILFIPHGSDQSATVIDNIFSNVCNFSTVSVDKLTQISDHFLNSWLQKSCYHSKVSFILPTRLCCIKLGKCCSWF